MDKPVPKNVEAAVFLDDEAKFERQLSPHQFDLLAKLYACSHVTTAKALGTNHQGIDALEELNLAVVSGDRRQFVSISQHGRFMYEKEYYLRYGERGRWQ